LFRGEKANVAIEGAGRPEALTRSIAIGEGSVSVREFSSLENVHVESLIFRGYVGAI
jgi:hypothetical protein